MAHTSQGLGGHLLAWFLAQQRVDRVFGVPGESFLPLLDGLLAQDIPFITCRQEGGASMMAEAHGKFSNQPGICAVTRAPGATNASAGVHVAFQDSSPMILLIGHADSKVLGREAFQEVDLVAMFDPLAKWAVQINHAERIPEIMQRAFYTALSGRPGPVVVVLPEDILNQPVSPAFFSRPMPIIEPAMQGVSEDSLGAIAAAINLAQRPLILAGGGGWQRDDSRRLIRFAEDIQAPVLVEFRRQDLFPNDHPSYGGQLGFNASPAVRELFGQADLLILLGARLGEVPSQDYTLVSIPQPAQSIIQLHPDPHELGRTFAPSHAINAHPAVLLRAWESFAFRTTPSLGTTEAMEHRKNHALAWRSVYEQSLTPTHNAGALQWGEIVHGLSVSLDKRTIVCNGAGNYAIWLHRFYQWTLPKTQLAPASGSMGYALPAAIAVSLATAKNDDPPLVVAVTGDGDLMMTVQELATASKHRLPIIVLVINNGKYGTIAMHQSRQFPGRAIANDLHNPDFTALAQAFGLFACQVHSPSDFNLAFSAAQAHLRAGKGSALLELIQSPEVLVP